MCTGVRQRKCEYKGHIMRHGDRVSNGRKLGVGGKDGRAF